ncbi:MAG: stage 0 sporulation family protein [Gemmatimonadales bacterium]
MPGVIEVRFKGNRRGAYAWQEPAAPRLHAAVIVEAERGEDLGFVHAVTGVGASACDGCDSCDPAEPVVEGERPCVVRLAGEADLAEHARLREDEDQVRRDVAARAAAAGLAMRISDAEWQWDRQRLTVYFTAERRVDFRGLVRDLAARYRTRIDLRQIGVRDEAARLGGIGRCGREFCCSTWLTQPGPVNLGLAKDQRLSLNPAQISGGCGRLLCCLKYEHQFYVEARKRFPKEGRIVTTLQGEEKVIAVDPLREQVALRGADGTTRSLPLVRFTAETRAARGEGTVGT